jgi:prevent-host-death family protein
MGVRKLQNAKARLSELADRARREGPQVITRRGEKSVVVVAYEQFAGAESAPDFKVFLCSAPLHELDLRRTRRKRSSRLDRPQP